MNTPQVTEGSECVTISYGKVRGLARNYPYFQPATYQAVKLASGELAWKYVGHVGIARRSWRLATRDAALFAAQHGLLLKENIRQWMRSR